MNSDLCKFQVQKSFKNETLTQLGNCLYNHLNFKKCTRLRGRPRNRWRDEVKEGGRIVGEGWQEKVHNREEGKKLLRTARNRRILHMPME
jgi:hypothetical protein